ncbi:hypothetical protein GPECTOR_26g465 [Gonium pectorale]|uniref:Uncharacterized protein n=1 Tax=Gonium pectorale TaxID=33097 RepID=A0A150GFE1_GONPE|nr:hypothetical protein GPECTOR_26g465 [Gonium pectorale]|eukprot:KXZ48562.1 hypothetical protein GPECTOR_26g465 [Gonium pectorale]
MQQAGASAAAAPSVWAVLQLPPDLVDRIIGQLDHNEVVTTVRLVNAAAAARIGGPERTTVHLSQPVPPHAFAAHWLAPGATRRLTLERRIKLQCLTAASGVVANLDVAQRATGRAPTHEVLAAAAAAGQLAACQWLVDRIWDSGSGDDAPNAAAAGGHIHVCEWLLFEGKCVWTIGPVAEAARHGHVGCMMWLLQWWRLPDDASGEGVGAFVAGSDDILAAAAAEGCDLPFLQQVWQSMAERLDPAKRQQVLAAAAGSATPDWAAKVQWLEAQGCPRSLEATQRAAALPDAEALAHLTWLRGRGFPVSDEAVEAAASNGNMAALQYLLVEVPAPTDAQGIHRMQTPTEAAARGGHLAALQALVAAGWPVVAPLALGLAARGGQLSMVLWLLALEAVLKGVAAAVRRLVPGLFRAAAESGSVELLAWLRDCGCGWDSGAYIGAAESGCVAALEWLAERVCPMLLVTGPGSGAAAGAAAAAAVDGNLGSAYMPACDNGDLATARSLLQLGYPWGPVGWLFLEAAAADAPVGLLRWLLEAGCPVDLGAVRAEVELDYEGARAAEILALLNAHEEALLAGQVAAAVG